MGILEEKKSTFIEKLREEPVPAVRNNMILFFARDASKAGELNLYEEYLLQADALFFQRQSYTLPAWGRKVGILDILPLLNMKMMALLFGEETDAKKWEAWGMEAYRINIEKRPHYILDDFPSFLHGEDHPERLEELLKVRNSRSLPFSEDPYHDEYFPYNLCRYEEMLLERKFFPPEEKIICSQVEDLLVEIGMIQYE